MELKLKELGKEEWKQSGVKMPSFDFKAMIQATKEAPVWLHFGAGNIFRGFIAQLQQQLLEKGRATKGIIAGETFDFDIIDQIYNPYDNLTLLVGLKPDGTTDMEVVAGVADSIKADMANAKETEKLRKIVTNNSLQMISFTITEKGYALRDMKGEYTGLVQFDMKNGPSQAKHTMSIMTALLYDRFIACSAPIAMVSMDNCSHNGEKLKEAIVTIARAWVKNGFMEAPFLDYIENEEKVSFPWSMIDKITPRPAKEVEKMLQKKGISSMAPMITSKNTFIAPFVNAEIPQYLVIEDRFPNGRPALENAGVYMTDRDTVNKTEQMKVTTCLNPLHTALAVYGCLLGYTSIASEMKDIQLKGLIEKIGYDEGMKVVVDPKILRPMDFIHEVIDVRLPNPFIPDMPQRIATDTSQKVPIRFGETIKAYAEREDLNPEDLTFIPLAIAGWCRYLLGIDDEGKEMVVSSDPMLSELQGYLQGIVIGQPDSCHGKLKPILSNKTLFPVDLYSAGIGLKIEKMFEELIEAKHAVRKTLIKYVG